MILPLPERFDANEIFIIISSLLTLVLLFLFPRRVSVVTIHVIWTFNIYLALLADITIGIKPNDFYFTIDHEKHELFDIFLHFFTYPSIPYFVVNFYQQYKPKSLNLLVYIIFCAGVAIALEWISVKFHVFTYTGWKLSLSFMVYLVVFAANIGLSNIIEKKYPFK